MNTSLIDNPDNYFDNGFQEENIRHNHELGQPFLSIIKNRVCANMQSADVINDGHDKWAVRHKEKNEVILSIAFGAIEPKIGVVGFMVSINIWDEDRFDNYFFENTEEMLKFSTKQFNKYQSRCI